MICPNCGTENADYAKFCKRCGSPLSDIQPGVNEPESHVDEANGHSCDYNREDISTERNPGKVALEIQPVDINNVGQNAGFEKKSKTKVIVAVIIVVVIAALAGAVFFVYENTKPDDNTDSDWRIEESSSGRIIEKDTEPAESTTETTEKVTEPPENDIIKSDGSLLFDYCNLLSAEYEKSLEQSLRDISNYCHMDIAVLTVGSLDGKTPEKFAADYYEYNGYGQSSGKDGAVLLLCPNTSQWCISTNGTAGKTLSDRVINYILEDAYDNVSYYFRNDDWRGGFDCFVKNCKECLLGYSEEPTSESSSIPAELRQYSDNLVEENRWYVVSLEHENWKVKVRSTPEYFSKKVSNDNTVGLIKSGTEIFVEYIYDGTWAVYKRKDKYVFSSLYDSNDPSRSRLINPKQ